jgi:hypothetical protein
MGTKAGYIAGVQRFFDNGQSFEVVESNHPVQFIEDFLQASLVIPVAGSAESGMNWVKKIVGAAPPTVAGVGNAAGGQVACTLTAASQKQDAAIYMDDNKAFDVTKGLIYEARVQLSVLPSAAEVQMVWGLSSNWIDGPDNAAQYVQFGVLANGAILCRAKDGTTTSSAAASNARTLLNTEWAVFRIECQDVTGIRYYIDGVDVTPATAIPFAATSASAILQPYASAYKASGTGVGTLTVDSVKAWMNRA